MAQKITREACGTEAAVTRLRELTGYEERTIRAMLTIAADPGIGKYEGAGFRVRGDDDEQVFIIEPAPAPDTRIVGPGKYAFLHPARKGMGAPGVLIENETDVPVTVTAVVSGRAPDPQQRDQFTLDESRLTALAENYPVDDDHSALLAIEAALPQMSDEPLISGPVELAADLLADGDGELDGLRFLLLVDDGPWLASRIFRVSYLDRLETPTENGGLYDTAAVIRKAVEIANEMLDDHESRGAPAMSEPAAEIECCGRWLPYPAPGETVTCPGCQTRFTANQDQEATS